MLERKGNFLVEKYGDIVFAGLLGNCSSDLHKVIELYSENGKYKVDFGEPESLKFRDGRDSHFLAGNVFEPELVHLTAVRYESGEMSLVNWGYGDSVLDFTEDFASITCLESVPPEKDFEESMAEDIVPIKRAYDTFYYSLAPEMAKILFTEAMRVCKQYGSGGVSMN